LRKTTTGGLEKGREVREGQDLAVRESEPGEAEPFFDRDLYRPRQKEKREHLYPRGQYGGRADRNPIRQEFLGRGKVGQEE